MVSRFAAAAVLVLLSTGATLALAEYLVREFKFAPPLPLQYSDYVASELLPYGPRPGSRQSGVADSGEYSYDFVHNQLGLRDVEHPLGKAPGTWRILALGDSFTYGVGASFEESYLFRLEARLNARPGNHRAVEVIKAGVPRFFPEAERALLEKLAPRFAPDLIVVAFVPNDLLDTCIGIDAITVDDSGFILSREARQMGPLGVALYRHSHVARLLLAKLVSFRADRECRVATEQDWVKVEAEYDRMAQIAEKLGARLLITHIPVAGPWSAADEVAPTRLRAWADRHGAGFVDVLPAMRSHPAPSTLYYPRDRHCTPTGYGVIADVLFAHLSSWPDG